MSGHSHAKNVQHKKNAIDKKKSAVFGKLLKAITVSARSESNPEFNPTLRSAVDKAKQYNIPSDSIERAIKKSSEKDASQLEELTLEAYGPEGVAILITAITDNSNRTIGEVKTILKKTDAKWAEPGSVLWAFAKNNNEWTPKFPQNISAENLQKLNNLIENLEDNDDITNIITSAKK
ncbi:MAG: YebC/PmpR family DNA-binding transcriptional regulator [Candidatus Liptonbacteria bacterium CG11_big_fil_rev_8_21_14_0_20_35_14]|uniref:YebC/PmpR family DNA-binding transcriptional regulator n=1 Tax=Candidatus Liptonbacteria bacterium CG11_big_fil_rev_8_21_14_0_20_35_14 TaxID=1974634 RepID=A0A2H0N7X9_9BACT|nr:MAG: YebC/PmpR family DNA-binding transcriptional regulator [Candidatus Liptonbacteria bacterium CG11_big_fil_rev_8_21_14_0_20_35_14]